MDDVSCGDKYVHLRMSLVSFICPILCIGIFMQGYNYRRVGATGWKEEKQLEVGEEVAEEVDRNKETELIFKCICIIFKIHLKYVFHTSRVCISYFWSGGMHNIPKNGMHGVRRNYIPKKYVMHAFVLTVSVFYQIWNMNQQFY